MLFQGLSQVLLVRGATADQTRCGHIDLAGRIPERTAD